MTHQVTKLDAVDFLGSFDDQSVDVVLTDPDYGITPVEFKRSDTKKGKQDAPAWVESQNAEHTCKWTGEVSRILKPGGHFFCFQSIEGTDVERWVKMNTLFKRRTTIIWCKTNPYPASNTVPSACEKIVWASKKGAPFHYTRQKPHRSWFDTPVCPSSKRYGHPTAKHPLVGQWFADRFIKEGDIVVDPFAGSGNLVAAAAVKKANLHVNDLDPEWNAVLYARFGPQSVPF